MMTEISDSELIEFIKTLDDAPVPEEDRTFFDPISGEFFTDRPNQKISKKKREVAKRLFAKLSKV